MVPGSCSSRVRDRLGPPVLSKKDLNTTSEYEGVKPSMYGIAVQPIAPPSQNIGKSAPAKFSSEGTVSQCSVVSSPQSLAKSVTEGTVFFNSAAVKWPVQSLAGK